MLPPYSHVGYFGGIYKIRKLVFDKLHNDEHSKHALRAVKALILKEVTMVQEFRSLLLTTIMR